MKSRFEPSAGGLLLRRRKLMEDSLPPRLGGSCDVKQTRVIAMVSGRGSIADRLAGRTRPNNLTEGGRAA